MGGIMPYARFRTRNNLNWRPTDAPAEGHVDPYPRTLELQVQMNTTLVGDLNRFERDVLGLGPYGDILAQQYADDSGTDIETVRKVLAAVFLDQQYQPAPILGWNNTSDEETEE